MWSHIEGEPQVFRVTLILISVPKKLKVKLVGEVKEKCTQIEGIYNLASILKNKKPFWSQEFGTNVIWYDKEWKNWKIGLKKYLGTETGARVLTHQGTGETALPHEATPWKCLVNNVWTASDDIIVTLVKGNIVFEISN